MELVFELKHALEKWLSFLQLLHFCPRAWHWSRPFWVSVPSTPFAFIGEVFPLIQLGGSVGIPLLTALVFRFNWINF